jgi:hypothetical protein
MQIDIESVINVVDFGIDFQRTVVRECVGPGASY